MIDAPIIYITETDMERLENLIELIRKQNEKEHIPSANTLEKKLEVAETAFSEEIPSNVVTMRSKVRLYNLETGKDDTYTLVFPNETDDEIGKISILAPLATAILGLKLGDDVVFETPSGLRKLSVDEISYQPK